MLEYTEAGDGARLMMLVLHARRAAGIRLRASPRTSRHEGRDDLTSVRSTTKRRRGWLVRNQHEERLEAHFRAFD